MKDDVILLNHGSGTGLTTKLVEEVFLSRFGSLHPKVRCDSAIIDCTAKSLAFTTDSFVVRPRFFPGGDIGKLAVCGTVNDLAVSGAVATALGAAFVIEEGFSLTELCQIADSMAVAASQAGVSIVTGDTKVVERGKADGLFITTSGIGIIEERYRHIGSAGLVREGDVVMVNGCVGDHGMAILAMRNDLHVTSAISSDCAPLCGLVKSLLDECNTDVVFMRDATRGGVGTVLCELGQMCDREISIDESRLPVRSPVRSMCDMFGFDPLFIANEGKVVVVVRPESEKRALEAMKCHEYGRDAAVIGRVGKAASGGNVVMNTLIGGKRIVMVPQGDQIPRIC